MAEAAGESNEIGSFCMQNNQLAHFARICSGITAKFSPNPRKPSASPLPLLPCATLCSLAQNNNYDTLHQIEPDQLPMSRLVLASTSPFRKELLAKLHLEFVTDNPQVDETPMAGETPLQLVARLAEAKARAVAQRHAGALIIGSDQVAVNGEAILGKPGDHARAAEQLRQASGKRITFLTGLALCNSATGHCQVAVEQFSVVFRQLRDEQIENYLRREQPYNCAGSFKSEGLGIALFQRLEGDDPNALIGLPLIRLVEMLEQEKVYVI